MLLKMPGINSKNYRKIMNKVQDIAELTTLSEEDLSSILGHSQHAKLLWDFLHKEPQTSETSSSALTKTEGSRKTFKRKR